MLRPTAAVRAWPIKTGPLDAREAASKKAHLHVGRPWLPPSRFAASSFPGEELTVLSRRLRAQFTKR